MKLVVEVDVVDKIKPSSPTLPHLRHHDLSFLDQIATPLFMPFLLFYHNDRFTTLEQKLTPVKSSLSKALSVYYPIAGKVKGDQVHEAVNLRQRTTTRLSFRHFENIIVILKIRVELADMGEREIVSQAMELIRDVDMECVKQIQDAYGYLKLEMEIMKDPLERDMLPIPFTSLCRFPMYEVDLGWGKPAWVSTVGLPHSDMVSFWDAKDGESIEVYVTLRVEDMAKFEKDHELLSYIS